jgi:hypothetical protein
MIMEATCKLGEKGCWNDGKCRATSHCENKIVTNADRIRAMSDEELAKWLCSISTAECCDRSCPARDICDLHDNGLIKWLKQPVKENDNG